MSDGSATLPKSPARNVKQPRGVRNNNPGNIDRARAPWQGEDRSPEARAREHRFAVFVTPEAGFRALARILRTYRTKHGLVTVRGIIGRWAPPHENNTAAYVAQVAKAAGVGADEVVDVRKMAAAFPIAKAIARHENGGDYWPDEVIRAGLEQGGVV